MIATVFWGVAGFLLGVVMLALAWPRSISTCMDDIRPLAPAAHLGGGLPFGETR